VHVRRTKPELGLDTEQHLLLKRIADLRPGQAGNKSYWPKPDYPLDDLKADVKSLIADAGKLANQFVEGDAAPGGPLGRSPRRRGRAGAGRYR